MAADPFCETPSGPSPACRKGELRAFSRSVSSTLEAEEVTYLLRHAVGFAIEPSMAVALPVEFAELHQVYAAIALKHINHVCNKSEWAHAKALHF